MDINSQVQLAHTLSVTGKKIAGQLCQRKGYKTSISAYDDFGNTLFEHEENQTVLGGALFSFNKLFGIDLQWDVETLNSILNIANTGEVVPNQDDTFVCLFGVGIGGSGEVSNSVKDVKFYEREIQHMIPLRVTDQDLTEDDMKKYWFRQGLDNNYTAYYLKTFDNMMVKNLWKDGVDGEDGSPVPPNVYDTSRKEPIESFIELTLRVDKKDCKEYFNLTGNVEQARVNTLGLFTGVKKEIAPGVFDYKNVKLFSKLNFDSEKLQLRKGVTFVYRVYVV